MLDGRITGKTVVVGVLGFPIAHSLSPIMHNAAFAALGLDWVYIPCPVEPAALPRAVAGLVALGLRGVNVTIPHKQAVLSLVDRLTPEAEAVGSVNTLAVTPTGLLGHSTDGPGFLRALTDRGFTVPGARVTLLGAGGAARAVVGALAMAGAGSIAIVARRPEAAESLVTLAARVAPGPLETAIVPWDDSARAAVESAALLVNATSIGMAPHGVDLSPVPADWLHPGQWVDDLVYTPRETALLRAAAARGCVTVDGTAMLVNQGAEAFTLWTGQPAPVAVMTTALLAALQDAK